MLQGWGRSLRDNFVDHTGVVVESSSKGHVKGDSIEDAKGFQVVHQRTHLLQSGLGGHIGGQGLVLEQGVEQFPSSLPDHVGFDLICHLSFETLLFDHFLAHISPGHLIQFVDGTGDGTELLCGHPADLEDTIEDLPVVGLDAIAALPAKLLKHFGDDSQDLRIRNHGVESTGNIKVTLVKFPHATLAHGGLVPTVDLGNVVTLNTADIGVHSEPPGKRNGQIVAKRTDLPALILEVVDEFRVLTVFTGQDLAQFENGGVQGCPAMALEDIGDGVENAITEESVGARPILGALGGLEIEIILIILGHGGR